MFILTSNQSNAPFPTASGNDGMLARREVRHIQKGTCRLTVTLNKQEVLNRAYPRGYLEPDPSYFDGRGLDELMALLHRVLAPLGLGVAALLALKELVQAAGLQHPGEITAHHIVRRVNENDVRLLATLLPEVPTGALLQDHSESLHNVFRLYWPQAQTDRFGLV